MGKGEELSDEQWGIIEGLIPELPRRTDGRGRPWRSNREIIDLRRKSIIGSQIGIVQTRNQVQPQPKPPPAVTVGLFEHPEDLESTNHVFSDDSPRG
jgi:hypothetical protein